MITYSFCLTVVIKFKRELTIVDTKKKMLENTEGAIKNGKSRETGNNKNS
jgi:hypothetical protein